ncbi:hypothetical protein V6Z11_D03G099100 [Gossypium hirsutum]
MNWFGLFHGSLCRMLWLIKHLGLEKELPLQWELTKTWIMLN